MDMRGLMCSLLSTLAIAALPIYGSAINGSVNPIDTAIAINSAITSDGTRHQFSFDAATSQVSEPITMILMGGVLVGVGLLRSRRAKKDRGRWKPDMSGRIDEATFGEADQSSETQSPTLNYALDVAEKEWVAGQPCTCASPEENFRNHCAATRRQY